jgi:excinuclease UvrABC ATPase subunit
MLSCLIGFIGLRYCDEEPGPYDPAIYLNSLPGITIESLDGIAEEEQKTFKGVWADIQTNAARQFKIDVINQLRKCYKLNTECNYEELVCDNLEILVYAWMYLCAVWYFEYALRSTRLNKFTTIEREEAEQNKNEYTEKYKSALEQAVQLMDVSQCELCCGGNIRVVTYLP